MGSDESRGVRVRDMDMWLAQCWHVPHGTIFNAALPAEIPEGLHRPLDDMVALAPVVLNAPSSEAFYIGHLALQSRRDVLRLVEVRVVPVVRAIIM